MTDESQVTQVASTKLFCDLMWKMIDRGYSAFERGATICWAIMVAIGWYLMTQEPQIEKKGVWLATALAFSVVAGTAGLSLTLGIVRGIRDLEHACERLDKDAFENVRLGLFYRRARRVAWVFLVSGLAIVGGLAISIALLV
jgi:hypothetical protein